MTSTISYQAAPRIDRSSELVNNNQPPTREQLVKGVEYVMSVCGLSYDEISGNKEEALLKIATCGKKTDEEFEQKELIAKAVLASHGITSELAKKLRDVAISNSDTNNNLSMTERVFEIRNTIYKTFPIGPNSNINFKKNDNENIKKIEEHSSYIKNFFKTEMFNKLPENKQLEIKKLHSDLMEQIDKATTASMKLANLQKENWRDRLPVKV